MKSKDESVQDVAVGQESGRYQLREQAANGLPAMRGIWAVNHLRAIVVLPCMVTLVIPATLLWWKGPDTFGWWQSAPIRAALSTVGAALICFGLVLMAATVRLFATVGRGTLAPWNPTQRLVVHGVYRYVRNPMISGVLAILLGEAVLAVSLPIACWFLAFFTVNAVYIPLSEEPGLLQRFGEDYAEYRRNVPRWVPRLTAWSSRQAN